MARARWTISFVLFCMLNAGIVSNQCMDRKTPNYIFSKRGNSASLTCGSFRNVVWTHTSRNGISKICNDILAEVEVNGIRTWRLNNVTLERTGKYDCKNRKQDVVTSFQVVIRPDKSDIIKATRHWAEKIENKLVRLQKESKRMKNSPLRRLRFLRMADVELEDLFRASATFQRTFHELRENCGFVQDASFDDVFDERATKLLVKSTGCKMDKHLPIECGKHCDIRIYRYFDGTCNHCKKNTQIWGSKGDPFQRLLPSRYENCYDQPVGWNNRKYNGYLLPSARTVSERVIRAIQISDDPQHSTFLMQWGQFLDHDLTFTPATPGADCEETCKNEDFCFPIQIVNSTVHRFKKQECIPFTRSATKCWPHEQVNQITAYIDASMVYGSSKALSNRLRDFNTRGQLRTSLSQLSPRGYLPFDDQHADECFNNGQLPEVPCMLGGDARANEQLGLLTMHVIWLREHNRIARYIGFLNSHWSDSKVYEEARKIVGALIQHITYSDWLPKIIGVSGMNQLGSSSGFDPKVNPGISNEFATAAFRFGHGLVQTHVFRYGPNLTEFSKGHVPMHRAFFTPHLLVHEGGVEPVLRGLFTHRGKLPRPRQMMTTELTDRLFQLTSDVALDLASLNIQRGRDHAIQSYNSYREHCGLKKATEWKDLKTEIRNPKVYKNPNNIDLFVGGLAENLVPGARVGPTFQCILVDQFRRSRNGDRFYYEHKGQFTEKQLQEIYKHSLARVVCDNTESIEKIPQDVFQAIKADNYADCNTLPAMNLMAWQKSNEPNGNMPDDKKNCKRQLLPPIDWKPNQKACLRVVRQVEQANQCSIENKQNDPFGYYECISKRNEKLQNAVACQYNFDCK